MSGEEKNCRANLWAWIKNHANRLLNCAHSLAIRPHGLENYPFGLGKPCAQFTIRSRLLNCGHVFPDVSTLPCPAHVRKWSVKWSYYKLLCITV